MDWKKKHADDAEGALSSPLLKGIIEEFEGNLKRNPDIRPGSASWNYGLAKVLSYCAQVARAQALGFDPELLRLSPEEANEALMKVAERAALTGKPVSILEGTAHPPHDEEWPSELRD